MKLTFRRFDAIISIHIKFVSQICISITRDYIYLIILYIIEYNYIIKSPIETQNYFLNLL